MHLINKLVKWYNIFNQNFVTKTLFKWAATKGHIEAHNIQYKNEIKPNCCYSIAKKLVLDTIHKKLGFDAYNILIQITSRYIIWSTIK